VKSYLRSTEDRTPRLHKQKNACKDKEHVLMIYATTVVNADHTGPDPA